MTLDENGKLERDEKEVTNTFKNFFVNVVPNLDVNTEHDFLNAIDIRLKMIFINMKNHPSIIALKNI